MTVVVADTSPLNYLLLIGEIAILQSLYGEILIPSQVLAAILLAQQEGDTLLLIDDAAGPSAPR